MKKIGVLALQGDFQEHIEMLEALNVVAPAVRLPAQLDGLDGLIIPGGESTTIAKLAVAYELIEPLRQFGLRKPVWGTCAGAIFLSKDARRDQPVLGLMDIAVERNAFGRQVDSFEIDLDIPALAAVSGTANGSTPPFHAIFIRAPLIAGINDGVDVIAKLDNGRIVAAQQKYWLVTSFHPELTHDDRFHQYFIQMVG